MKVPFYGHVRQYHALQQEIDDAIHAVLLSGEYVTGPRIITEMPGAAGTKEPRPTPTRPN